MAQYSDMQCKVLDELVLPHLKIDFVSFYEKALLMYLRGMTEENMQSTRTLEPESESALQLPPKLERGLEHIDEIREMVTRIWKTMTESRPESEDVNHPDR